MEEDNDLLWILEVRVKTAENSPAVRDLSVQKGAYPLVIDRQKLNQLKHIWTGDMTKNTRCQMEVVIHEGKRK